MQEFQTSLVTSIYAIYQFDNDQKMPSQYAKLRYMRFIKQSCWHVVTLVVTGQPTVIGYNQKFRILKLHCTCYTP